MGQTSRLCHGALSARFTWVRLRHTVRQSALLFGASLNCAGSTCVLSYFSGKMHLCNPNTSTTEKVERSENSAGVPDQIQPTGLAQKLFLSCTVLVKLDSIKVDHVDHVVFGDVCSASLVAQGECEAGEAGTASEAYSSLLTFNVIPRRASFSPLGSLVE